MLCYVTKDVKSGDDWHKFIVHHTELEEIQVADIRSLFWDFCIMYGSDIRSLAIELVFHVLFDLTVNDG